MTVVPSCLYPPHISCRCCRATDAYSGMDRFRWPGSTLSMHTFSPVKPLHRKKFFITESAGITDCQHTRTWKLRMKTDGVIAQ